jgi:uncharacterized protein (DUF488 family)
MGQIPLYTIGYGARDISEFIAVLQANHIAYLIDVRSKPYSRYKPDFSKDNLERHLQAANIRYVYMGDTLGGMPDDPDCYDEKGKVVYEKVAQKAFYKEGIGRLQTAWNQQLHVAIMCSEGKPETCHRTKLISKTLIAISTAGGTTPGGTIPVVHIDENDQLISQEDAMLRLLKNQPSLFGDDFIQHTSRKSYQEDTE